MTSTWAKAPDFAADPTRVEAVRAQTVVDLRTYLEEGMQPVECRACGTRALVRKNSHHHTSIEWQAHPSEVCPEYTESRSGTGSWRTCPRMAASIDHAVMEGIIEIRDES